MGKANKLSKKASRKKTSRKKKTEPKGTGSKAQVWHGTALRTSGRLTKKDLDQLSDGRIVSKKKRLAGKALYRTNKKVREALLKGRKALGTEKVSKKTKKSKKMKKTKKSKK